MKGNKAKEIKGEQRKGSLKNKESRGIRENRWRVEGKERMKIELKSHKVLNREGNDVRNKERDKRDGTGRDRDRDRE